MKESVLLVSDNRLFIENIFSTIRITNIDLISNQLFDKSIALKDDLLLDMFSLEETISKYNVIIYENLSQELSTINNVNALSNVVNLCVEYPSKRFIYLGNQKSYNTSPFEITMDEQSVNNFTKKITPAARQSILMELEVLRGINEGANGIIFSVGELLYNNNEIDIGSYSKVRNEKNVINYFTQINTLIELIIGALNSKTKGKFLIHDVEKNYESLVNSSDKRNKSIWNSIIEMFIPNDKMNKLILNNEYSRQQLKFELNNTK